MFEERNAYEGATIIAANDFTPKTKRVGSYWVKVKNGKYINTISITKLNSKLNNRARNRGVTL